ncbi:MAG: hypothetical protein ACJ768_05720 [Gaiellaceae bacterium]
MQYGLTIRIVGLSILLLSVGLGATSYLNARARAQDKKALAHVRAAVLATEAWYQDPYGGHGSFRRLSAAGLETEAPAVSTKVEVTLLAGGRAYCLHDVEGRGHSAYYLGGATRLLSHLAGAAPYRVTLMHSTAADAAAVCAAVS